MCLFSARRGRSSFFWIPHEHNELKTSHRRSNLATGWSSRLKSQCSSHEKAHQTLSFHYIMLLCAVVIFSVLAGETCLFYLITNSFDLKLLELHLSDHNIDFSMSFFRSLSW